MVAKITSKGQKRNDFLSLALYWFKGEVNCDCLDK